MGLRISVSLETVLKRHSKVAWSAVTSQDQSTVAYLVRLNRTPVQIAVTKISRALRPRTLSPGPENCLNIFSALRRFSSADNDEKYVENLCLPWSGAVVSHVHGNYRNFLGSSILHKVAHHRPQVTFKLGHFCLLTKQLGKIENFSANNQKTLAK